MPVILFVVGMAVTAGMFIYQNRKAENIKRSSEKDARRYILFMIAREIAQPSWRNLKAATVESLIRNQSRTLNLNLTVDSEFPILIEGLNSMILGDCFMSSKLRNELIARIQNLETKFKQTRPISEALEYELLAVEPQIKWLRVIVLFLLYFASSTLAALIVLISIVYFTGVIVDVSYTIAPFAIGLMAAVLSISAYFSEYRTAKKGHEKAVIGYEKSVLETIRGVLESSGGKATIRREYQVTVGDKHIIADLVLESAGERLPIEIKYKVRPSDIEAMAFSADRLRAKKGIIISYMKPDVQTKRLAQSKNVAIFEDVVSEADLTQIFKDESIV